MARVLTPSISISLLVAVAMLAQPAVARAVQGSEDDRVTGFLTFRYDDASGQLTVELPPEAFDRELLWVVSLGSGLGSNPVGLDRGQLGPQRVVAFRRAGKKVFVIAKNQGARATSDNSLERDAVERAFAPSVLHALEIVGQRDDAWVADLTPLLLSDAHGVVAKLKGADQGDYRVDDDRSAVHRPGCKAFPDNTELEALVTFTTAGRPGSEVAATAADGRAFTLRVHHSFVRLPDLTAGDAYRPRVYDPRIGYFTVTFRDYGTPLDAPLVQRWIRRHDLRKKDPTAAVSDAVEPIVYWIDGGTPEPIRSALIDGAMWWRAAFEDAGFRNAFDVRVLPPGVDPCDVRYNMIHWVHRATRGWSYGGAISDPRTGQILKGNVLLGSLRVRQDHMLFRGLGRLTGGAGACAAGASPGGSHLLAADDTRATELALARIRQLSAHEVGHSLGLAHNFAASTYDGRASVMDYPAPWVRLDANAALDFSSAYGVGIGSYDRWAIRWGYAQFAPGADEPAELARIVRTGLDAGQVYVTDQDARSVGAAHPQASLWDNGTDPLRAFEEQLAVRAVGLRSFDVDRIRDGEPLALLEDVFVPLYLHHRYQLEACAKLVGGIDFRYAVRGDGQPKPRAVAADVQRAAVDRLLTTVTPAFLLLPDRVVDAVPPHPPGYRDGERFERYGGTALDEAALAATATDLTLGALLHPSRVLRVQRQQTRDPSQLGLRELLASIVDGTWGRALDRGANGRAAAIHDAVCGVAFDHLLRLATHDDPAVQAITWRALDAFAEELATSHASAAVRRSARRRLEAFVAGRDTPRPAGAPAAPPGSPIGQPTTGRGSGTR